MAKCKKCDECKDDIVQIGFPTNTPQDCDEPELCSEIVPASCVVIQQDLLCGEEIVIPAGTRFDAAMGMFTAMFCEELQVAVGPSAYDVAVANGFVGTETQWLASLAGADGQDGAGVYKFIYDITTTFGGQTIEITSEQLWSCNPSTDFCRVQEIVSGTSDFTMELWQFSGTARVRITNSPDVAVQVSGAGNLRITFNQTATTSQTVRLIVIA